MQRIPYKYAAGLAVAIGLFMAVLDNTIVNVSLTAMQKSFGVSINDIQWVITAYFLAQAAVIPAAGYFGARIGTKRLYLGALAIFTFGSLVCGLTGYLGEAGGGDTLLIFARVLQGIGGGMLFPLGTAISFGAFPPEERAASSAIIAVPVLIAPALGPTVGGLIVDSSIGWPGIFFINVPVGIAALFIIARVVRPDARNAAGTPQAKFDFVGLGLSMVGVTLVAYAFTLVSQTKSNGATRGELNGWGYPLVWILLVIGLAALAAFAYWTLRVVKDPVLDLRLFKGYEFTVASVMTWVFRATVFGSFFLIPLFLQQFRGLTAVHAGLIAMGQGIGSIVGIITGSRLYDRIGPRALVVAGSVVMTVSTFLLVGIQPDSDWQFFVPILFLRGVAFGWAGLPLQTVALAKIAGRELGKASSLYNATAQIFTSIGISVISTFLVQRTAFHAEDVVRAAATMGQRPPQNLTLLAGTAAMQDIFLYIGFGSIIVVLVGFLLPAKSLKQQMQRDGTLQEDTARVPVEV